MIVDWRDLLKSIIGLGVGNSALAAKQLCIAIVLELFGESTVLIPRFPGMDRPSPNLTHILGNTT
jgi:hypothetical protein